jgi:predicted PurR-regulated permease PerM
MGGKGCVKNRTCAYREATIDPTKRCNNRGGSRVWDRGRSPRRAGQEWFVRGVRGERKRLYGRLGQGAPLAVFVAAGLLVAYKLLPVLKLVAVAMLVAVVLRSVTRGLERLKLPPWTTPIVLLALVGALGVFAWLVVVPNLLREARILSSTFPQYVDSLTGLTQRVPYAPDLDQMGGRLKELFSRMAGSFPQLAMKAVSLGGAAVAGLFLAVYMSVDPVPLVRGVLRLVPSGKRDRVAKLLQTVEDRLRGWIVGTAIVSLFVGVGGGLGLWIMGVPLYISFGLIAGILNVVPYLGSTVGALLPALVALTISPVKAVLVLVLFVALNQIEGYILQPMVMGREVNLHPAMVIVSFLIAGALLGFVGVLLAVPAAVVCATLMDELFPEVPLEDEPSGRR